MRQQMFDLDRHVVGDARELARHSLDHGSGVPDAVEEIRIAERHVPGASRDLGAHVSEHDIDAGRPGSGRRRPERSGSAGSGACSRGSLPCKRRCVARFRSAASRIATRAAARADPAPGTRLWVRVPVLSRHSSPRANATSASSNSPPMTVVTPRSRSSEALSGAYSPYPHSRARGFNCRYTLDDRQGQPRGGVHGKKEGHGLRRFDNVVGQPFARQIGHDRLDPSGAECRGGGCQPERLTAEVVGRDEQRFHGAATDYRIRRRSRGG